MNEQLTISLLLTGVLSTVVLLFIGALKAQKGTQFWAIRLLLYGATLLVISTSIMVAFGLWFFLTDQSSSHSFGLLIISYFLFILGAILYPIAFFGFCTRWSATGKRRSELLEITSALAAAKEQAQRNLPPNSPSS
ncbi:MAG: hypothetical protein ACSHYB_15190 [Roseibacillus sp.]